MSPSVSLVMLASKPTLMLDAVAAITALVPDYLEFVVGASPALEPSQLELLRKIPRVRLIEGAADIEAAGPARFRLFDAAQGEWIVNVDDDDLWVRAPELQNLPADVGVSTGGALFLRAYKPIDDPNFFLFKRARPIRVPADACNNGASFWAVRKAAWESVAGYIDRGWWYSDWRLVYCLVRDGWKVHQLQATLGVVRAMSDNYPKGPEWEWKNYTARLEAGLPAKAVLS